MYSSRRLNSLFDIISVLHFLLLPCMKDEVLPPAFKWDTLHWSISLFGTSPRETIWLKGKVFYLIMDITTNETILLLPLNLKAKIPTSVIAEMLIKLMKSEV